MTNEERARLGGLAIKNRQAPAVCPQCGQSMAGRSWHSYLGHLGLHGLANRYFGGDIVAAQTRLRNNGLARQDPAAWNYAWPRYRPLPLQPLYTPVAPSDEEVF